MDWLELLKAHGQEDLLAAIARATDAEREELRKQVMRVDWELAERWRSPEDLSGKGKIAPIGGLKLQDIAAKREQYSAIGKEAIRGGKVAAVLLAGGQGTRLGSDAPKGTFDLGVTHPLYIFERLVSNLLSVCKACGAYVPLFVMTSEKNDAETRAFFLAHDNFGYPSTHLRFFVQEMAAAVDFSGNLLLEDRAKIAFSPNGNGGWYSSLRKAGLEEEFPTIAWYNVFAVDNVLQYIADPVFIGAVIGEGAACGAKVVRKCDPHERVGVLCLEEGKPSVIEYYEMSEEMATSRGEDGELLYCFGVILNYLFSAERLKAIAREKIPVHVVKKKIPHIDKTGNFIHPETENGYKFETLILDMVRLMGTCLPFEVEREKEFAPVKNRTGTDSVETARELLRKNGVEL